MTPSVTRTISSDGAPRSAVVALLLLLVALLGGCSIGGGSGGGSSRGATPPANPARVVLIGQVAEGRYACVRNLVEQDLGLGAALSACSEGLPSLGVGGGGIAGAGLSPPGAVGGESLPGSASCPTGGVDPTRATRRPTSQEIELYGLDSTQRMYTDEERAKMLEERERRQAETARAVRETAEYKAWRDAWVAADALDADPGASQAQKDTAHAKEAAAKAALDQTKEAKANGKALQDVSDIPVATPPLVGRADPEAGDACQEMLDKITGCNDVGWTTGDCRLFLARLGSCGDPRITDPSPDAAEDCRLAADQEAGRKAAVLACQRTTNPAPGEDPCAPYPADAELYRYRLGTKGTACGDPKALTTEEQCVGTVSVAVFGRGVSQEELAAVRRKVGGPVIYLPREGPRPGPGPK